MQIVIDIPKDVYKETLRTEVWNEYEKRAIRFAIRNCIRLPKRHGKLKDTDELLTSERPKGIADDVWKESHIYKLLSNAPTIIEADKEND